MMDFGTSTTMRVGFSFLGLGERNERKINKGLPMINRPLLDDMCHP
jgi:hypothetical protein